MGVTLWDRASELRMFSFLVHLTGLSGLAFAAYLAADRWRMCRPGWTAGRVGWLRSVVFIGLLAVNFYWLGGWEPGHPMDLRGAIVAVATLTGGPAVGAATAGAGTVMAMVRGGPEALPTAASLVGGWLVVQGLAWIGRRRRSQLAGEFWLLNGAGLAVGVVMALTGGLGRTDGMVTDMALPVGVVDVLSQWLAAVLWGG